MDKASSGSVANINRRLSAVKVVVDLLNHELDLGKADKAISLERDRLDAAVTTLEDFIGDIEAALKGGGDDRKVVESQRGTVNRVN